MKKTTLLMLILAFGLVSLATAAQDTWTTKANMPTARGYLSTAVVNGKIYAFGGALSANSGTSVVEEYDPATGTWSRVSNMPEIRFAPSTTAVDGIIYLIGGSTSLQGAGLRTVYSFDPSTDTWTQKADTLTPRQAFAASVVDGKIYTIGGTAAGLSRPWKCTTRRRTPGRGRPICPRQGSIHPVKQSMAKYMS